MLVDIVAGAATKPDHRVIPQGEDSLHLRHEVRLAGIGKREEIEIRRQCGQALQLLEHGTVETDKGHILAVILGFVEGHQIVDNSDGDGNDRLGNRVFHEGGCSAVGDKDIVFMLMFLGMQVTIMQKTAIMDVELKANFSGDTCGLFR